MKHCCYAFLLLFGIIGYAQVSNEKATELYQEILKTRNPYAVQELLAPVDIQSITEDSLRSYLYYYKGSAMGQVGKMDSALFYVELAQQAIPRETYPEIDIQILRALGNINWSRNFYNIALTNYQDALSISQAINNYEFQISLLGNIAGIYSKLDNLPLALEYALQAEEISQASGVNRPRSHMKIGNYQIDLGRYEEGIENLFESIRRIKVNNRDSIAMGVCYNYVARGYLGLQNYAEARKNLQIASDIFANLGYRDANILRDWALLELKEYNIGESIRNIEQAIEIANENGDLTELLQIKIQEKDISIANSQLYLTVSILEEIIALSDSIKSQETINRVYELETQFQTAQKDQQLKLAALEIERKERFQLFLILIIVLVVVFSIFSIVFIVQRSNLKKALLSQEIDTLRAQITTIMPKVNDPAKIDLSQLNAGLHTPLSERELEVLTHALTDKSNREIAEAIYISINTVKTHLKNLYGKLGVNNRKEALEKILQTTQ